MLTFDQFKTNLKDGKYKDAGGARKSIGKARDISDTDKVAAAALISKHFGQESKPAPKASVKSVPRMTAKTVTKAKPAAPSKKTTGAARTTLSVPGQLLTPIQNAPDPAVTAAHETIVDLCQALHAIKSNTPDGVSQAEVIENLNDIINQSANVLGRNVNRLESLGNNKLEKVTKPAKEHTVANGKVNTVHDVAKAAADFESSIP